MSKFVTYTRKRLDNGDWHHHVIIAGVEPITYGATTPKGKPQQQALVDIINSMGQLIAEQDRGLQEQALQEAKGFDDYWQEEVAVMGQLGEVWDLLLPKDYPVPLVGAIIPIPDGPPVKVIRLLKDNTETRDIARVEILAYPQAEE